MPYDIYSPQPNPFGQSVADALQQLTQGAIQQRQQQRQQQQMATGLSAFFPQASQEQLLGLTQVNPTVLSQALKGLSQQSLRATPQQFQSLFKGISNEEAEALASAPSHIQRSYAQNFFLDAAKSGGAKGLMSIIPGLSEEDAKALANAPAGVQGAFVRSYLDSLGLPGGEEIAQTGAPQQAGMSGVLDFLGGPHPEAAIPPTARERRVAAPRESEPTAEGGGLLGAPVSPQQPQAAPTQRGMPGATPPEAPSVPRKPLTPAQQIEQRKQRAAAQKEQQRIEKEAKAEQIRIDKEATIEQRRIDKETKPFYEATLRDADVANKGLNKTKRLAELVQSGQLPGAGRKILERVMNDVILPLKIIPKSNIKIDTFIDPASEEFKNIVASFSYELRPMFKGLGSMSDKDVELAFRQFPDLLNTPLGNLRIIDRLNSVYEAKRAIGDAMKRVIKKHGDKRPQNIELLTEEEAQPELQRIANKFKYGRQYAALPHPSELPKGFTFRDATTGITYENEGTRFVPIKAEQMF